MPPTTSTGCRPGTSALANHGLADEVVHVERGRILDRGNLDRAARPVRALPRAGHRPQARANPTPSRAEDENVA
jgi:hypothetical protein